MANPFDQFDAPEANPFDQFDAPKPKAPVSGGLVAAAKQAIGGTIKGAGQAAADFLPGVDQDNALKRYGQGVVDANPTAVSSLADLKDKPLTGIAEATGNAGGSMGAMLGARALGMGITAASPLAGPAAPLIAGLGQAVSWAGPTAAAALPSFGGIREKQIQDDPTRQDSVGSKLLAAAGAGTVGLIESKLGPNKWAEMALSKQGRDALAEKFVANSLAGSIAKGAAKGAAIEGAEELAQNPIEQLASYQNPLTAENLKDTAFSGVMGALGGGVLGGASGAAFRGNPEKPGQNPAATPTQQPAPTFDPAIQQQMLADQEQEALGINPADGPLSAVASTALHTGAAKTSAQIAIEQERQRMAEAMAQQDASESEIADATGAYDQAESQRQIRLAEEARRVEQEAKDKADFDTQWKQAQNRDDIRNVADQVLAEGAYEADQRKAAQSERMAQEPSLPFERIAPEDYDTLNPIKLGEGQLVDPVRPALPAPDSSRKALPNSQGGAPALGFTPQKPEPMRATAGGQVGTPQQFDDLARTKATRKDQMRRAEDRVREMVQAGARMRGRDLVAPSGAVVMPNLTLLQAAKARQFTREAPNAQQDQSQPAPAQAVQAEAQGSQQQPAVASVQDLSNEAPLAKLNIKEARNGTDNSLPIAEVAQKALEGGGVVIQGGGNAVDARAGARAEPKGRVPPESNPGVGQGALDANGEVAEQPNPAEPDSGLPDTRAGGSGERVAKQPKPTNLLRIVREAGGVSATRKNDVAQDSRAVGVFRSGGMELDSLAELLHQNGYLTDADISDPASGSEKAVELLREAIAGNRPLNLADNERAMSDAQEAEYRDSVRKRADELGVKWRFRKIEDVERDVQARENEVAPEDMSAYAYTDDGALAESRDRLYDIDLDDMPALSEEGQMRAMGFTEEEINEAISRAGDGEVQGQPEQAQSGAAQANSRRSTQENPGAQSSILESYSEQDLAARDEAQRLKAEEKARADKAAEDKARADSERDIFTLTGSDRPADVMAAQGQGGLFDQPAPAANQNPIKTETRANTGPEAEVASANKETRMTSQEWRDKGKSPSDLLNEKVDSLGRELAMTVAEEASQKDFAPNELATAVRMWADDGKVPADSLRIATLKHVSDFGLSDGRIKQIRAALNPLNAKNQEPTKLSVDLESLFADLDSSTVRKANKAKKAAKAHPLADKIQNVQDNFLDILQELEDSGKVKINC